MAGMGQPFPKLGTFFTKYVPHTTPIFEKKSHLKCPVEGRKEHGQYTLQIPHPAAVLIPLYLEGCFLVSKWVHMSDE